jgi:hypothetical protein
MEGLAPIRTRQDKIHAKDIPGTWREESSQM